MIGLVRGSSSVSPVSPFRQYYLHLKEANITRVVLFQARVRGDHIPSLHVAVGLLQGIQLWGVMIVVLLTIGLESVLDEVGGRLYQVHLHLNQFQLCLLLLEMVVRTRIVGTTHRVVGVELGEANQVVDRVHQVEALKAIPMQPQLGRRLRHLTMSS